MATATPRDTTQSQETAALWKSILVPVDFSDPSDAALRYAFRLAHLSGASLHVCHVLPLPHVLDALYERGLTAPETGQEIRRKARRHLKQRLATSGNDGPTIHMHFSEGEAAPGVLTWAAKLKADLIVMGTHGRRGATRFLMGSVAEAIVRCAPCPVLTVHAAQE
jgi:universal stress protein A